MESSATCIMLNNELTISYLFSGMNSQLMSIVIPATMPSSVCQTTPFTMKIMEYSMTMELSAS